MPLFARNAQSSDYEAFCRLFPELRIPDRVAPRAEFDSRIVPHAFFLFEESAPDHAVGYAFYFVLGATLRVVHVIVDRARQGEGIGRALMAEAARRGREAGCSQWTLNVKPDNDAAISLYTKVGMTFDMRSVALTIPWASVPELAGGSVAAEVLREDDDLQVERDRGLFASQIASLRAGGGRTLLAQREHNTFVGFAAFDPTFPGAALFSVQRPDLARSLLLSMRPFAGAEFDYVRFVVDLPELEADARRVGAVTHLEFYRMSGPLP